MRTPWIFADIIAAYRHPSVRWLMLRAWFMHVLLCGLLFVVLVIAVVPSFAVMLVASLAEILGKLLGNGALFLLRLLLSPGLIIRGHISGLRSKALQRLQDKA